MEEIDKKKSNISRRRSTISQSLKSQIKGERIATVKKVAAILQKPELNRSQEESDILLSCSDIVTEVNLRQVKRDRVKARLEEIEDPPDILEEKCIRLAAAISQAKSLTVYTGAGISTAASIPDYRGTNGVWTRLQQGKDIGKHDLSQAEPTLTHMALYALYKAQLLKYIVSQNCDGLHLRSGIPKANLSEVHGNMNVEVCRTCKPSREYWRLFDVTEKTGRYSHRTGRTCHACNSALQDSIVHFGERGNLLWPINWNGASKAAKQADVILCIGSSLKVLKRYPWLWQLDKSASKRAQLYIVNLQWTPKDENSALKINGKCDEVMKIVMSHLGLDIPKYNRSKDPIFYHAIKLQSHEMSTTSQPFLEEPTKLEDDVDENLTTELINSEGKPVENVNTVAQEAALNTYPIQSIFTALPFLSMGLPFPNGYMFSPISQLFYYYPLLQIPTTFTQPIPKPKPTCISCMKNERSMTCLFYQRNGEDPVVDSIPKMEEIDDTKEDVDDAKEDIVDTNVEQIQEIDKLIPDENVPIISAKNPGWFGKGYRKSMKPMKKKR